jgi:hypothetical protein
MPISPPYPMLNDRGEAVWDALVLRDEAGRMQVCVLADEGTVGGEPRWVTCQFDNAEARVALMTLDAVRQGGGTA